MSRKTRISGLAALGLLVAGTAHALPPGWYRIGPGIPYKCHGNYTTDTTMAVLGVDIFLGAADIRACQAICDRTPGCVAFNFQRRVSASGTVSTTCVTLGRSDVHTVPISDPGRFDWGAVCYRTYAWEGYQIDDRYRFRIEERPGLPGYTKPFHPNKP